MVQLSNFSSEPSLVQNGSFSQGLSHWFGSYLRHNKSQEGISGFGGIAPTYEVVVSGAEVQDYLNSIEPGVNQFIDLPELYTYPSQRVAFSMLLRPLGSQRYTLVTQSTTLVGTNPPTTGDLTASGPARFYQHPFLFVNDVTVPIEAGTTLTLKSADIRYSAQYRVGNLVLVSGTTPQSASAHVLQLSGPTEVNEFSSKQDFPRVSAAVGGPNAAGFGVVRFIGEGHDTILTYPRSDGTTGIKVNDTLVIGDKTVSVFNIAVTNNTTGTPSYNIEYENLIGVDGVNSGFDTTDWEIIQPLDVDIEYIMPLYRYDFTLSYAYQLNNSFPPAPAKILFKGYTDTNISGIGTTVGTIQSDTDSQIDADFVDSEIWQKRYEYLAQEFAAPVKGRMMLNIPPPGSGSTSEGQVIDSLDFSTVNPVGVVVNYTTPATPGDIPLSIVWDGVSELLFVTQDFSDLQSGESVFLTGTHGPSTNSAVAALNAALEADLAYEVVSNTGVVVVIRLPLGLSNATANSATGLSGTVRLTRDQDSRPQFKVGNTVKFTGNSSYIGTWIESLLTDSTSIISSEATGVFNNRVVWRATLEWNLPDPLVVSLDLTSLRMVLASQAGDDAIIGDISLYRGYQYYRMNVTDVADVTNNQLSDSVTLDRLISHSDAVGAVIPQGSVMLYSGGGTCPGGFKPVRNFADSKQESLGIRELHSVPWPDSTLYDPDTDTTTLRYETRTFNQLDENGLPILLDGQPQFTSIVVPGVLDPNGDPVVQQLDYRRAKQIIEPGMMLRVRPEKYTIGDSTIVDTTSFTEEDYFDPFGHEDQGYLVSNIEPFFLSLDNNATFGSAIAQKLGLFANANAPYSTYAGGTGTIGYPSVVKGEFDLLENTYPNVPPPGPSASFQTERFPIAGKPFAYFWVEARVNGNGALFIEHRFKCREMDVTRQPSGLTVDGTQVLTINNAFYSLSGDDRLKTNDVLYARLYSRHNGTNHEYIDSFFCRLQYFDSDRWNIYRYDGRPIKLLGLGRGGNLFDTIDGDESRLVGAILVLHPVKLYGSPGKTQATESSTNQYSAPQGTGEEYVLQRLNINGVQQWVSRLLGVGTEIQVTGNMHYQSPPDNFFVEPSGYVKYGVPYPKLDYGTSGHSHTIAKDNDHVLSNPIPKVHRETRSQYQTASLPLNHGHLLSTGVVYPLPKATLFTLCIKL